MGGRVWECSGGGAETECGAQPSLPQSHDTHLEERTTNLSKIFVRGFDPSQSLDGEI